MGNFLKMEDNQVIHGWKIHPFMDEFDKKNTSN